MRIDDFWYFRKIVAKKLKISFSHCIYHFEANFKHYPKQTGAARRVCRLLVGAITNLPIWAAVARVRPVRRLLHPCRRRTSWTGSRPPLWRRRRHKRPFQWWWRWWSCRSSPPPAPRPRCMFLTFALSECLTRHSLQRYCFLTDRQPYRFDL